MVMSLQGFGGGNLISGNLLFNTGRGANKDEGSFNSWCPYLATCCYFLPHAAPQLLLLLV